MDLECLLRNEPPRLARQHSQYSALEDLANGQTELPEATVDEPALPGTPPPASSDMNRLWLVLLGLLFAVSFIINLVLLLT
jgi:hypothetical protein